MDPFLGVSSHSSHRRHGRSLFSSHGTEEWELAAAGTLASYRAAVCTRRGMPSTPSFLSNLLFPCGFSNLVLVKTISTTQLNQSTLPGMHNQ
jgi:hypothetical protein